jgi:hypothetical protein
MTQKKKNNNNKKELRFLVTRATPTQGGAAGLAGSGLARQVWLMSDVPSSSYILSNI